MTSMQKDKLNMKLQNCLKTLALTMLASTALAFTITAQSAPTKEKEWLILSSGSGTTAHEAWYVGEAKLHSLPSFHPENSEPPLSAYKAVAIAITYAAKRYSTDKFVVTEVSLQKFASELTSYPIGEAKDWIYLIHLEYNEKGWTQIVPVLLDGSVVLSNIEAK